MLFDPAAVDKVIAEHIERPAAELELRCLYTAKEIEALTGITAATIRAERSKGALAPSADDTSSHAHRWKGSTVTKALAGRRAYHKDDG
ncbi:hypothetical protein K4749_04370 [Streptomyces sp. TRM72054]|uniref:hypothetical protein n=1 Tax=Streptomyces sp. TRM72054 TaxID=2870562 RepID=UPI001C8B3A0F|nr:hypothetical protein [Streptomyces sp. TRM72054]MBX9392841.1 hypothetical protein [Streptomyces sp. TRM72054]